EVFRMFPGTKVLFSFILPRRNWRGQSARSTYGVERSRRWVNGSMAGFLAERRMRCIRHYNIDPSHLIADGVHLSPGGNELFMRNLKEALQAELRT
ncbi:MAG: hypothetical protein ACRC2N_00650, partial [Aeromonas sp.]